MKYLTVQEATPLNGLRIAFTRGLPVPWGVAVRAIFELKKLEYIAVEHEPGGLNLDLVAWTGQGSAPVAAYNDERVRIAWSEMLLLAERLAPTPALLPADQAERVETIGLTYEICGEGGLGWNIRLLILNDGNISRLEVNERVKRQYKEDKELQQTSARINSILDDLSRRVAEQTAKGSRFLIGKNLTAADIYWAAFSIFLNAPGDEICPLTNTYAHMPDFLGGKLGRPIPANLIQHRDWIMRNYFKCPMVF